MIKRLIQKMFLFTKNRIGIYKSTSGQIWLPVTFRIYLKVLLLVFKALNVLTPLFIICYFTTNDYK